MYKIPASTLFLGKNLLFMPECHSTNSWALDLCQQSCPAEGTVVITDNQTSGRGQRGNSWEAQPGMNLTFSLILKPTFLAIKDQFMLSIMISVSIRDYLAGLLKKYVLIKWPNDILVNEFKICGILIENQLTAGLINYAVVGIGLNVNQKKFTSPSATSISLIQGSTFELQNVLNGLLEAIQVRYLQLRQNNLTQLRDEYLANLYRKDMPSVFVSGGQQFEGKIVGVDGSGRLKVLIQGEVKIFDTKDIAFTDFNSTRANE